MIDYTLDFAMRDLNVKSFTVRRIDSEWECSMNVGRGVEPPVRGHTFLAAILAALEKVERSQRDT